MRRNALSIINDLLISNDKSLVITMRERTRSLAQNSKLWAMLSGIVKQVEWYGHYLTQEEWRKSAGLIGIEKDTVRSRAIQLYPTVRVLDKKSQGQTITDVIFIARCEASYD